MSLIYEVKKYFNVLNQSTEWIQVNCPYHEDNTPSAGINCNKQWFNCFTCGGKTFKQLYDEVINVSNDLTLTDVSEKEFNNNLDISSVLESKDNPFSFLTELTQTITEQIGQSFRIKKELTPEEVIQILKEVIISKGISPESLDKLKVEPVIDPKENFFGYMKFPIQGQNGDFVARKFLPDEVIAGDRYLNPKGEKPYFGEFKDEETDYILVEGIFDYISLLEAGYPNVICNLGTAINDKRAFPFRNKVVFILFDNDYAGFTGANKAYTTLRKVQAHPIILDLPKKLGKDINEALVKNKEDTLKWLASSVKVFDNTDEDYMLEFKQQDSLYTLKTGIKKLDEYYGGGLKVGLHAIAAEPGVGKTALSLYMSHNIVHLNNAKGLYCTYEIPKSQCWARLASIYDKNTWRDLEANPHLLGESTQNIMKKLASKLRIVAMWDINEIVRAARNYDFIVIDYIQRMPGDTSDEKSNTKRNTKELSKLMMEEDKVIILISSIPRIAYGKEDLSVFKECGDIEFCIQSGMLLKDINKGGEDRKLHAVILKNTRGPSGCNFWLNGDMTHNRFEEIEPTFTGLEGYND